MHRKMLVSAISLALAVAGAPVWAQDAADATSQDTQQNAQDATQDDTDPRLDSQTAGEAQELDRIVVTGSRIPRSETETASPVTVITGEEIERQGFRNVSDALRALPLATGSVQDNQYAGFTATATTISLLGLSPSFTLTLLDGRPLADYPLLYNGQSNFTDLTSIPVGMVERIDIVPGNQSSIYGSAAIAGVVNIILKKKIEGVQLNARVGSYTEDGGDNARLQLTGGMERDRFNMVWGVQYSEQDPIYLTDRDYTDTTDDNPNPDLRYGSRTFIILNGFTQQYDDPGALCDNVSHLFGGTTQVDFRPGRGNFCGSRAQPGYISILNDERNLSGYFNGRYAINDGAEAYATVLLSKNKAKNDSGSRFWVPDYNGNTQNYVWNVTEQTLETYQRIFAPEEMPDDARFYTADSESYSIAAGVEGRIGQSDWDYDAYLSRSGYKVESDQLWPLVEPMEDFFREQFMGPQLGTYYGYPVYAPNKPAMYQALTPEQFRSFSGNIRNVSRTWTQNANLQLTNAELFELPAGPVGFATVLQAGEQYWDNPIDPRVSGGEFFGINGTSGRGKRRNQALGVEFSVPVFDKLTASLAARYDAYQNVGAGEDAAPTWKLGLEFRPVEGLLLRGNVGTAFRAPDMGYIFTGGNGFFSSETDFYKCEIDPDNCDIYTGLSVEANQLGNPDLESITADSYGFGFVWSPSANFDIRADYYNVSIDDEVLPQSTTQTLADENDCRQGRLDINSERCQDAISRVIRTAPNPGNPQLSENIDLIIVRGVNIAKEEVSGITAGANWRFDAGRVGQFNLGLEYNLTLDHTTQSAPDSPVYDTFSQGQLLSAEFKSIVSGDIGWELGRWSANLHGVRYGSLPNYAKQFTTDPDDPYITSNGVGPGTVRPWMLYNLSVGFDLTDNSQLSLIVNNLRNSRPPEDPSYDGSQGFAPPYYNIFAYNGYGRSWWVEYKIDFGK
jgi:outer membrane receptor protein involved in Fe transport